MGTGRGLFLDFSRREEAVSPVSMMLRVEVRTGPSLKGRGIMKARESSSQLADAQKAKSGYCKTAAVGPAALSMNNFLRGSESVQTAHGI